MIVVTWNMQGSTGGRESKWYTDVQRLFKQREPRVEVALLQEAGVPPESAVLDPAPPFLTALPAFPWDSLLWNLGTAHRPDYVRIYWVQCDPGANRNNLAIAFRPAADNFMIIPNPIDATRRPSLGIRFPHGAGTLDVYTFHAFSGGGHDAPGFLTAIDAVGAPWVAGGDFNRDPATVPVPGPGNPCLHATVITHPGSGTNLDYAYSSLPATAGVVDSNFVVSDHFPVYYDF